MPYPILRTHLRARSHDIIAHCVCDGNCHNCHAGKGLPKIRPRHYIRCLHTDCVGAIGHQTARTTAASNADAHAKAPRPRRANMFCETCLHFTPHGCLTTRVRQCSPTRLLVWKNTYAKVLCEMCSCNAAEHAQVLREASVNCTPHGPRRTRTQRHCLCVESN